MNAIDVVKAGLAASEAGQSSKFAGMLSDDMVFSGPVPEPVGKREFVGLMDAMVAALPDWKFNARDFKENGDKVTVTFQITGTQTGELNLPMPGFHKIPATGKHVSLPKEPTTVTVKDGKISRLESAVVPGGGVSGVLAQLGSIDQEQQQVSRILETCSHFRQACMRDGRVVRSRFLGYASARATCGRCCMAACTASTGYS
jgi:ketosteroid isomerase-like protein